jgi:phage tail-like protein
LEIEGVIAAGFSEVTGLSAETEIEEFREGGVNDHVHKFPRLTRYPNLTLKRGLTDSRELWKWHQQVVQGKVQRKTIYVILLDREGNVKWRWSLLQAFPAKWVGPDLKADGSAVALESMEIAHHGLTE